MYIYIDNVYFFELPPLISIVRATPMSEQLKSNIIISGCVQNFGFNFFVKG